MKKRVPTGSKLAIMCAESFLGNPEPSAIFPSDEATQRGTLLNAQYVVSATLGVLLKTKQKNVRRCGIM